MDGGITLIVGEGNDQFARTFYGFWVQDRLYDSSNHWIRTGEHEVLENPDIGVQKEGEVKRYAAVPIGGE